MSLLLDQLFSALKGDWLLKRFIRGKGKMEGTAHFKITNNNHSLLHYSEEGKFTTVAGISLHATREYFYSYNKNIISVFFVENNQVGELFHTLEFKQKKLDFPLKANALHLCCNDLYSATYEFINYDQFNLSYVVKGPHKNYMMNTLYQRV